MDILLRAVFMTFFVFMSRPAIMPIVEQTPDAAPASTKERHHPFVMLLEEQYEASGKTKDFIAISDFDFVSCDVFENNARLVYCRDAKEKNGKGQTQIECLLIMFQLKNSVWEVIHINRITASKLDIGDHSDCINQILKDNQTFCLPGDDLEPTD